MEFVNEDGSEVIDESEKIVKETEKTYLNGELFGLYLVWNKNP